MSATDLTTIKNNLINVIVELRARLRNLLPLVLLCAMYLGWNPGEGYCGPPCVNVGPLDWDPGGVLLHISLMLILGCMAANGSGA